MGLLPLKWEAKMRCIELWHKVMMMGTWTGQGWQQDIPVMPINSMRLGVITCNTYLMVAGGKAEDDQTLLGSIDVMDSTTRQWWCPCI